MEPVPASGEVALHLRHAPLPWLVRRAAVERLWRSVATEARAVGDPPLRVVHRRHAIIDGRAAGLLGFDGFLIAALAGVFALDLLQGALPTTLAAVAALALLLGSGTVLGLLRMPAGPDTNDAAEFVAAALVDLARRTGQYRHARLLTELAGALAAMVAGSLISPYVDF